MLEAARQAAVSTVVFRSAAAPGVRQDQPPKAVGPPGASVGWKLGALGLAFGVSLRREELRLSRAFDGLCHRRACRPGDGARAGRLVAGLRRLQHYRRLSFGAAALGATAGGLLFYLGSAPLSIGSARCRAWVGFGSGGFGGDF